MQSLARIPYTARLCVGERAFRSLENIEYNMCRAARYYLHANFVFKKKAAQRVEFNSFLAENIHSPLVAQYEKKYTVPRIYGRTSAHYTQAAARVGVTRRFNEIREK